MKPHAEKHPQRSRNGSAVLITLVLVSAMVIIVIAGSTTLFHLKSELRRIEERQLQRHGSHPPH